jgi:hypothetical protein
MEVSEKIKKNDPGDAWMEKVSFIKPSQVFSSPPNDILFVAGRRGAAGH